MSQETETYSAETSFSDFVQDTMSGAETMSDTFPGPPSTSPSSDAPGAPPVEPSAEPGSSITPPVSPVVDPQAPIEPSDATLNPEPDPFKDASSLTYTVNGEVRTFEDLKVIPGVGAVIQASALPNLERRLVERDSLFERSQQQYTERQALERLMTWTQTVNGQPETITGPQAIESMRVALGRSLALNDTLSKALEDPETFASLVGLDGQNNIVLNQSALKLLSAESRLAQQDAERMVRHHWQSMAAPPASQAPAPTPEESAPRIAAHFAQQFGQGVLTQADTDFLATQAARYVRPATVQDLQTDPTLKVGQPVIDPAFAALVQDRAELRKQSATAVTQASSVAAENAQKLRAALLPNGKAPVPPNTSSRPVPRPTPTPNQAETDRHALFLNMEQAAARTM